MSPEHEADDQREHTPSESSDAAVGATGVDAGAVASAPAAPDADADAVDAELAETDLAAWIDAHDPEVVVELDRSTATVLAEQRAEHEPDERDTSDGVGDLVNNTGDDGGAASG